MPEPFHHSSPVTVSSSANGDHLSVRLIVVAKIVFLRFAIDHVEKELSQLRVCRAGAEWRHDVELEITAETRAQFAVAGESQLVAALAEMQVRHRTDETDALSRPG